VEVHAGFFGELLELSLQLFIHMLIILFSVQKCLSANNN
jgi:hypothetical protein